MKNKNIKSMFLLTLLFISLLMLASISAADNHSDEQNNANVSTSIPMEKYVGMDSKVSQTNNTDVISNDTSNYRSLTKTDKSLKSYPDYDPFGYKNVLIAPLDPQEGDDLYPDNRPLNVIFTAKYQQGINSPEKDYNGKLNITVNNNQSVIINGKGIFTFNYTPTSEGLQNIMVVVYDTSDEPFYGQGEISFNYHRFDTKIINQNDKITGYADENIIINSSLQYDNVYAGFENVEDTVNVTLKINDEIFNLTVYEGNIYYNYTPQTTGTYNVTLTFEGNEYYKSTNNSWNYTVKPYESELTIDNLEDFEGDIYVADKVVFNLTLRDLKTKKAIPNATITVISSSDTFSVKTDEKGHVSITNYTTLVGKHTINFKYPGNDTILASNNTLSLEVLKRTPVITLNEIEPVRLYDTAVVHGQVLNISLDDALEVNIIVDDTIYLVNMTNNTGYVYHLPVLSVGLHNVTVYTSQNGKYYQSGTVNSTLTIEKLKTSIYIDDISFTGKRNFKVTDSVIMLAELRTSNDEYDSGDVLLFNITSDNDELFSYNIARMGNWYTILFTQIPAGIYNITAYTKDTDNYTYSENSTTITVEKIPVVISAAIVDSDVAVFSNVTVKINLEDQNGDKLIDYPFMIEFNDEKFEVESDENGEYTFTRQAEHVGNNTVGIILDESYNYTNASKKLTFNVHPLNATIDVNATDVTLGQKSTITLTLSDELSNRLSNQVITVEINGKTNTTSTDDNGCAVIHYHTTTPGINNVTATYDATTRYNSAVSTGKFNVCKHQTNISLTTKAIRINETEEMAGRLVDENGDAIGKVSIVLSVDDDTIQFKTDENGYYTYDYAPLKAGLHRVSVELRDDVYYDDAYMEDTFNVTKYDTTLTLGYTPIEYSNTTAKTTISGLLLDELSNPVNSANITLEIDGETHEVCTLKDGSYKYDYESGIDGLKNVSAAFDGDNYYNPAVKVQTNFEVVFENQNASEDDGHVNGSAGNDTPVANGTSHDGGDKPIDDGSNIVGGDTPDDTSMNGNDSGGDTPKNPDNQESNVNINATNDTIENSNMSSDISNTTANETNSTIKNTNAEGNITNITSNITNSTQDNVNTTGNVTDSNINSNNTDIKNTNITGNGTDVVVNGTNGTGIDDSNVTGNGTDVVVNGTNGTGIDDSNVTSNSNGTVENNTGNTSITNSNITSNATNVTGNVENVTIEDSNITSNITNASINQNNTHIDNSTSVTNDTQNTDSNSSDISGSNENNNTDITENMPVDDNNDPAVNNSIDQTSNQSSVENNATTNQSSDDSKNTGTDNDRHENRDSEATDNTDSVSSSSDDSRDVDDSELNDGVIMDRNPSSSTYSPVLSSFADVVDYAIVDSVVVDSAEETVNKAYELSEVDKFIDYLKRYISLLILIIACIGIGYYYKKKN
ncbi:MAG: hypothetical protein Q4Q22_08165 [Methanosphaera sp.]|nr:hypothetical protein [Methanosphaera sp.]